MLGGTICKIDKLITSLLRQVTETAKGGRSFLEFYSVAGHHVHNSRENLVDTIKEREKEEGISTLGPCVTVPPLQLRLPAQTCAGTTTAPPRAQAFHPAQLRCLSGLHNKVKRTSDYASIKLII